MKHLSALVVFLFSFNVFAATDESDFITNNGNAYIVATVVNAGAGFRAVGQLWNPEGSGKTVYLDKVTVAHGYCMSESGVDLRISTVPFGAVTINGTNKNLSITAQSVAQLRAAHVTAPVPGYTMYEIFPAKCYVNSTVSFNPPFRIPPGNSVYVATGNDNSNMPVTFEFREY